MLRENQHRGQRQGDERGVELTARIWVSSCRRVGSRGFAAPADRSACETPKTVPTKPSVGSTQIV